MLTIKEEMTNIITSQSNDASYDEIIQELLFKRMVDRGLEDSQKDRTITNEEMQSRILKWQQ